jgi:hypothetical protein
MRRKKLYVFCAKQFSTGAKKCQGKLADCQIESANAISEPAYEMQDALFGAFRFGKRLAALVFFL